MFLSHFNYDFLISLVYIFQSFCKKQFENSSFFLLLLPKYKATAEDMYISFLTVVKISLLSYILLYAYIYSLIKYYNIFYNFFFYFHIFFQIFFFQTSFFRIPYLYYFFSPNILFSSCIILFSYGPFLYLHHLYQYFFFSPFYRGAIFTVQFPSFVHFFLTIIPFDSAHSSRCSMPSLFQFFLLPWVLLPRGRRLGVAFPLYTNILFSCLFYCRASSDVISPSFTPKLLYIGHSIAGPSSRCFYHL